jgi:hypothetical protein
MTGNDIFEITMSLIDERLDTGIVDATSTAIFKKNAPYLLTALQDELIPDSQYFKTYTITKVATTTAGGYSPNTMPTDFYSASQIISIETDGNREDLESKWESNNILLVDDNFVGTIKVIYRPIPDAITALTDAMVLDTITCRTTMAYGLASRLLTNENRVLSNYFNQLYEESRNKMRTNNRPMAGVEQIKDKLDNTLSY